MEFLTPVFATIISLRPPQDRTSRGQGLGRGRGRPRTSIFGNVWDVRGRGRRGRRRPEEAWWVVPFLPENVE